MQIKKNVYRLKQAPRQWYHKFNFFMVGQGYARSASDRRVYVKKFDSDDFMILLIYIDKYVDCSARQVLHWEVEEGAQ